MKKLLLILLCLPMIGFAQERHQDSESELQYFICALNIHHKNDNYIIKLRNQKILDGVIKNLNHSFIRREGEFICYMLNKNRDILDSLYIGNPLKVNYEYNDKDNKLGYKELDKLENEIIIRFQFNNDMEYLNIVQIKKDWFLNTVDLIKLF